MPKPRKGENREHYIKRALPVMVSEGLTHEQALGKAEGWFDSVNGKRNGKRKNKKN